MEFHELVLWIAFVILVMVWVAGGLILVTGDIAEKKNCEKFMGCEKYKCLINKGLYTSLSSQDKYQTCLLEEIRRLQK